jgi:hypothetical protein
MSAKLFAFANPEDLFKTEFEKVSKLILEGKDLFANKIQERMANYIQNECNYKTILKIDCTGVSLVRKMAVMAFLKRTNWIVKFSDNNTTINLEIEQKEQKEGDGEQESNAQAPGGVVL